MRHISISRDVHTRFDTIFYNVPYGLEVSKNQQKKMRTFICSGVEVLLWFYDFVNEVVH